MVLRMCARTLFLAVKGSLTKSRPLSQPMRYFAGPHLLDYNGHVNNSMYLVVMEKARLEYSCRVGWMQRAVRHRIQFIVASTHVQYLRPIAPLATIYATLGVADVIDGKWLVLHQMLLPRPDAPPSEAYATAVFKCCMVRRGKTLTEEEMTKTYGFDFHMDDHPAVMSDAEREVVKTLMRADYEWRKVTKSQKKSVDEHVKKN